MRKLLFCLSLVGMIYSLPTLAQIDSIPENRLNEVILQSARIDIPLVEDYKTVHIITARTLQQWNITSTVQALERITGVDVRQRGPFGVQGDLQIRGGGFEQTLLLIDGIKLDDPQTGHHTLNFMIPLEIIERIEVIKGPSGRIFGQNAFTGAINFITKTSTQKSTMAEIELGNYNRRKISTKFERQGILFYGDFHTSDGYRYNSDFKIQDYFLKASVGHSKKVPIDFISMFSSKDFGANGFYATPEATDQYEETQASLIAFNSTISTQKWTLKPKLFWRRHQDIYLFVRDNPEIYRNLHISNKIGVALDTSFHSIIGSTGIGVNITKVFLASNNLGDRQRTESSIFVEQRMGMFNQLLDLTAGFAYSHYTDFGSFFYPGIDLGLDLTKRVKLYGNLGYTYRIPTYTDLFYSDPTTLGNDQLKTEEMFSQEIGAKYQSDAAKLLVAFFNRNAINLIDYVKEREEDRWEANNLRELHTWGMELDVSAYLNIGKTLQEIRFGYTYLNDTLKDASTLFSRYSINSLKHQFTVNHTSSVTKFMSINSSLRYGQKPNDLSYLVVDVGTQS